METWRRPATYGMMSSPDMQRRHATGWSMLTWKGPYIPIVVLQIKYRFRMYSVSVNVTVF